MAKYKDKELFDKMKMNPDKYEYMPIPTVVRKILRPHYIKDGHEYILLAHTVKDDKTDEKVLLLQYVYFDGYHCEQGAGMCTGYYEEIGGYNWKGLAEDIASTWEETAVKHRKAKI